MINRFAWEFSEYERFGRKTESCQSTGYPKIPEPVANKMQLSSNLDLTPFSYFDPRCEYDSTSEPYCQGNTSLVPHLASKLGESWLSGRDHGEWGGELVLFNKNASPKIVLRDNVEDIYVVKDIAYVVTGLAHLGIHNGFIFQLTVNNENNVRLEKTHRLPGAPRTSWKISETEVLINTVRGSVIFDTHTGFKEAKCLEDNPVE